MRLKPPVALPQVLITPHDIGDLLRYGWLRKTVSYESKGGALTMNLDVAVTLTDPMHGVRVAGVFMDVIRQQESTVVGNG